VISEALQTAHPSADSPGPTPVTSHVAKHAGIALLGQVLSRFVGTVVQIILARGLGAVEFGFYALGWSLLRCVASPLTQGISSAMTYFGIQYLKRDASRFKSVLAQSFLLAMIEGGIFAILVALSASVLATRLFGKPHAAVAFLYFSPAFVLFTTWWIVYRATTLSQRMQYSVCVDLATQVLNLLFLTAVFMAGWRLRACIGANIAATVLGLALALYYTRRLFPAAFVPGVRQIPLMGEIFVYSLPTVISGFVGGLVGIVDRFFVGVYGTSSELGIYQAASQVPVLFAVIIGSLSTALAPTIADLHHRRDSEGLRELFIVTTKWSLYIAMPLFLLIGGAPRELLRLLYGGAYMTGSTALVILTAGQFANVSTGVVGWVLTLTGNQRQVTVIAIGCGISDIVLNFLLVPRFGMTGAALGASLTCAAQNLLSVAAVKRKLSMSPYDRRYLTGLLATLLCVGAMIVTLPALEDWRLKLLATAFGSFCMFPALLTVLGLDAEDWVLINALRRRFIPL
jgi:O-antigen/teichoic acid export membrane protein